MFAALLVCAACLAADSPAAAFVESPSKTSELTRGRLPCGASSKDSSPRPLPT